MTAAVQSPRPSVSVTRRSPASSRCRAGKETRSGTTPFRSGCTRPDLSIAPPSPALSSLASPFRFRFRAARAELLSTAGVDGAVRKRLKIFILGILPRRAAVGSARCRCSRQVIDQRVNEGSGPWKRAWVRCRWAFSYSASPRRKTTRIRPQPARPSSSEGYVSWSWRRPSTISAFAFWMCVVTPSLSTASPGDRRCWFRFDTRRAQERRAGRREGSAPARAVRRSLARPAPAAAMQRSRALVVQVQRP